MKSKNIKTEKRLRLKKKIRMRIAGDAVRPRLAVFRSNRFISVQLIDDETGKTLGQAHGREFPGSLGAQAAKVGVAIAERAKKAGIDTIVFDRGGYAYAAQIKALADAAREGGLKF